MGGMSHKSAAFKYASSKNLLWYPVLKAVEQRGFCDLANLVGYVAGKLKQSDKSTLEAPLKRFLAELEQAGLIESGKKGVFITNEGRLFLKTFDMRNFNAASEPAILKSRSDRIAHSPPAIFAPQRHASAPPPIFYDASFSVLRKTKMASSYHQRLAA